jgi:hypothetical protein
MFYHMFIDFLLLWDDIKNNLFVTVILYQLNKKNQFYIENIEQMT